MPNSSFWNSFCGVWLGYGTWYTLRGTFNVLRRTLFKNTGANTTKALTGSDKSIKEYEEQHNVKVVPIIHKEASKKSNILNYFLNDDEDTSSLKLSEAVKIQRMFSEMKPDQDVIIILHTPGGEMSACKIIVDVIRHHTGNVKVFVPFYAFSAGTVIALASDEILMHPTAVMGPTDPQLLFPVNAFLRVIKNAEENNRDVHDLTRLFGEIASPARQQSEDLIRSLVESKVRREYEHYEKLLAEQDGHEDGDTTNSTEKLSETMPVNSLPYIKDGVLIDESELNSIIDHLVRSLQDSIYTHDHSFNIDELTKMGFVVRHEPKDYEELYKLSNKIIS